MNRADFSRRLSRRIGSYLGVVAYNTEGSVDALDKPGCPEGFTPAPLPDGWGTSPRRAPSPAKAYKPTHGGYPGEVKVQECVPTMLGSQNLPGA